MKQVLGILLLVLSALSINAQSLAGQIRVGGAVGIGGQSAAAGWSFIQEARNESCTGSTCAVTVSSVGAGHLLVYIIFTINNVTLSSVSAETLATCSNCHVQNGGNNSDGGWTLSATGGETTITCTFSGTAGAFGACRIYEFSYTGTASKDDSGNISDTTCTTCAGVALTVTGASDVLVQSLEVDSAVTAVTGCYSGNLDSTDGVGSAYCLNQSSDGAPNWTQSSSGLASGVGLAFKHT